MHSGADPGQTPGWHGVCINERCMEFSRLSDQALLSLASNVGQEISRRWTQTEDVHINACVDAVSHLYYRVFSLEQEHLYGLYLNAHNILLSEKLLTIGTVNASLIHAREVFSPALKLRATALVLVHNHPSGHAMPSKEDLRVTEQLKKAAHLIGIELLDHIIIGKNEYYSHKLKHCFCF